jgi:hypothetical protein
MSESARIGCNGQEVLVGPVDSNEADSFAVSDLVVGSARLDELRKKVGVQALSAIGAKHRKKIAGSSQTKPAKLLNPQMFLDRVKQNSLAPYLTALYEMFFRAEDPEKIQLILDEAYVDTAELREYDQVLHSMLGQIERALPEDYWTIQTDRKREYTLTPELGRYEDDTTRGRPHHRLARIRQIIVYCSVLPPSHARVPEADGGMVRYRLQPSAVLDRQYRRLHLRKVSGLS